MSQMNYDKMIIAICQQDEYHDIIADLNEQGFYVTILHSTGGFLKRQSITIMIGLHHERLQEALDVLKKYGEHTETHQKLVMSGTMGHAYCSTTIPVPVFCGGIVLFVLDVERAERY